MPVQPTVAGATTLLKQRSHLFLALAVALDALLGAASWMACYAVRFRLGLMRYMEATPPSAAQFAKMLPIVILCDVIAMATMGLYKPLRTRSLFNEWVQIANAAILAWMGTLAVLYYASDTPVSRKMLFMFLFVNTTGLIVSRWIVRKLLRTLRRRGWGTRHAAIIGTGRLAQEVFHRLQKNPWLGVQVDYFVEDENERRRDVGAQHAVPALCGVPVSGSLSDLLECMETHPVDSAFVAVPAAKADKLDIILETLSRLPVTVSMVPDFSGVITLSAGVDELEGLPVVQLRDTPIGGWKAVAKRALDMAGALLLFTVFGLPTLILALLVKMTSPGPVFFEQVRMGLGGRRFKMLKFRSMRADAEERTGPTWAAQNDPRRTWIGAIMRRTSLDELPQLINVLRGDMSLVGPRPERPHFVEQFVKDLPAYMLRHNVKAGLTGWAQVNGLRGNTSLKKRLQYDLYYINNWSLRFDLFILLTTPFAGLVNKHAY